MTQNILHKLQSQIFKRTNHFTFLNKYSVDVLVELLTDSIVKSNFEPDIVVGILSGGEYPATKISKLLSIDYSTIDVSHYAMSFFGIDVDEVVGAYRIARLLGFKPKTCLVNDINTEDVKNKNILLVDDDSYSGLTMKIARTAIVNNGPYDIKSAVLHTYDNNSDVDFVGKTYTKRDFYDSRLRFPWSKISPHYNE